MFASAPRAAHPGSSRLYGEAISGPAALNATLTDKSASNQLAAWRHPMTLCFESPPRGLPGQATRQSPAPSLQTTARGPKPREGATPERPAHEIRSAGHGLLLATSPVWAALTLNHPFLFWERAGCISSTPPPQATRRPPQTRPSSPATKQSDPRRVAAGPRAIHGPHPRNDHGPTEPQHEASPEYSNECEELRKPCADPTCTVGDLLGSSTHAKQAAR